jgi:hypothetical protein
VRAIEQQQVLRVVEERDKEAGSSELVLLIPRARESRGGDRLRIVRNRIMVITLPTYGVAGQIRAVQSTSPSIPKPTNLFATPVFNEGRI